MADDLGSTPGSNRFPEEGNGNVLIKKCLIPAVFFLGKSHGQRSSFKTSHSLCFFIVRVHVTPFHVNKIQHGVIFLI